VDFAEKQFQEDSHGYVVVGSRHKSLLDDLFFNMKLKINELIKECLYSTESGVCSLEQLHDDFDNYDLSRRDIIDQFIWSVVDALLYISSPEKQRIIEQRSLMHRVESSLALLDKNIHITHFNGMTSKNSKVH